jgi:DHA1 family bicyclomycin/chloramphenicol resistance-like MFS transporter
MSEPARFTWLIPGLGLLACLGPFSNDLYVPSLSLVAQGLGTDAGSVQLTMTAVLIGFSVGALIHGPLADRFGRKPVLCAGLAAYAVAGMLAALSEGLGALIAARVLQGISASAAIVLTRAIVLDRWTGTEASRVMSWISIFMFIAPVLAPLLGGYIAAFGYWPAVFWFQAAVGVLALIMTGLFLNRVHSGSGASMLASFRSYGIVLTDVNLIGYMMCTACAFIGLIAFVSTSSIVFVSYYGLTPTIQGLCFSTVMLGAATGSFFNSRMVSARGISAMLSFGTSCLGVGGLLVFTACLLEASPPVLVATIVVYVFGIGFVFANTLARMMSHYRQYAAAVSAAFASNQLLLGAFATIVLSRISTPGLMPLGISVAISAVLTVAIWWGWLRNSAFTRRASGNAA